jgi:transposase
MEKLPPELWNGLPSQVQAYIRRLEATIAQLEARVATLEGRPPTTPQNSSLPPSAQHPHAKPTPAKPTTGKPRGGQPGHPKHDRPLLPVERCDAVEVLRPTACRRCQRPLTGHDPQPLRQQVWELPEVRPTVTEYQRHRLACPGCGETTCAPLPRGVPTGQSGPRLAAFTALLMAYFRQSKRRAALFLQTWLGQPCCPALTVKLQNQVTQALRPVYTDLQAAIPDQPRLGIDESPTKQARTKAWLWTFVAERFTVFALRPTRKATVLDEVLTERFAGVVTCDRAKMYGGTLRLQWCWAHLKRKFQAWSENADGVVKRLGHDLLRVTRKLFAAWGRYRAGTLTWRGLRRQVAPLRRQTEDYLLRGACSGKAAVRGTCDELCDHPDRLWRFADVPGVEPTNNASERALRHGVIWRKLSFGTQSEAGSRFVETLLTVIETCRQQGRSVFTFVTEAVKAAWSRVKAPSLVLRL